jgi:serine/threonine protein kinase
MSVDGPPRPRTRVSIYGERRVLPALPKVDGLTFGRLLGEGHFSHVYEGTYRGAKVAIKVIERGSAELIAGEIDILMRLRGAPNIVQLFDVVRAEQTLLIFEHLRTMSVDTFLDVLTIPTFRIYLRELLTGLAAAHERGILHLDVKPGNVAVSPHWRTVKLIDWGCGAFVGGPINVRGGSKLCHPPEMMLGYPNCGTGCDIWATGVLVLYVLTDRRVPWAARRTGDMLVRLGEYVGGGAILELAGKLGLDVEEEVREKMPPLPVHELAGVVAEPFVDLIDPDLIDLTQWLLTVDPTKRPSAVQALGHRFLQKTDDVVRHHGS